MVTIEDREKNRSLEGLDFNSCLTLQTSAVFNDVLATDLLLTTYGGSNSHSV